MDSEITDRELALAARIVTGCAMFVAALVWSAVLFWSNVEMTSRQIAITYPWQTLGHTVLAVAGWGLAWLGLRRDT